MRNLPNVVVVFAIGALVLAIFRSRRAMSYALRIHSWTEARLTPVTLGDGLTLWGAAHRAPANTPNLLDGFRTEGGGVHVALLHGSCGAVRVGYRFANDGKKVRVCRKCGSDV